MTTSSTASTLRPLHIGMFGGGTVGGGVYEIIMNRLGGSRETGGSTTSPSIQHSIVTRSLRPCIVTKVCVRDLSKSRSFSIDSESTKLVTDVNSILDDESIDIVVEVMGGTDLSRTVVLESLKRGKSVVTANKALIAGFLEEIQAAVVESGGKSKFAYEAAVGGGIPIMHTLHSCYVGDIIHEVMGVCNGTTNYMLGKMELGAEYENVLKEAQDLGYAEADPTADVEGHDVQAKISILAKLAFGTSVPVESVPCMGITQIAPIDFEYAKILGCTIKLVGTAKRLSQYGEHDGALSVYVAPKLVPLSHLLASACGSGNVIVVRSANVGISSYTGPGAGRFATANSVVADICRISSGYASVDPFPHQSNIELDYDYISAFYIRIPFQDKLGIIRRVGELAERNGVSINSVFQNPIKDRMMADFVVTTEECGLSQVQALCDDISAEDFSRSDPLFMPMLLAE